MKIKRIISFAMCLIMLVCCGLCFVGCDEENGGGKPKDPCEHEWGEWSFIKAPTCEAEGEKTHSCIKCGGFQLEKAEKIDHVYKLEHWTWSDSKKNAYLLGVCTYNMKHTNVFEGKIEEKITVAATCGKDGQKTLTATVEYGGKTYTDEITVTIPATGNHTYVGGVCTVCQSPEA